MLAQSSVSGRWTATADFYGTPLFFTLDLTQRGEQVTGNFGGDTLEGTFTGDSLHFIAKDDQGGSEECNGIVQGGIITGTIIFSDDATPSATHQFSAKLVPVRRPRSPQRHEFTPTAFYRQFSALNKPVLNVWPGDTIHTTTLDAGGTDEHGITRVLGGNPETGPFYIETAVPGDTLVVHLTRVRLNRDWAFSDDGLVEPGTDERPCRKDEGRGQKCPLAS